MAEWILKKQSWDLEKAITWYYQHKNDTENYKRCFEAEIEDNTNIQGKSFVSDP